MSVVWGWRLRRSQRRALVSSYWATLQRVHAEARWLGKDRGPWARSVQEHAADVANLATHALLINTWLQSVVGAKQRAELVEDAVGLHKLRLRALDISISRPTSEEGRHSSGQD